MHQLCAPLSFAYNMMPYAPSTPSTTRLRHFTTYMFWTASLRFTKRTKQKVNLRAMQAKE
jgi:hypothetical protein